MKNRTIMFLALLAFLAMCAGCARPLPQGVKGSLYTAQLTLSQTVKDAAATTKEPWTVNLDATVERKLAKAEFQVILLLKTMEQADKNLQVVVEYFRTGKTDEGD